MLEDPLYGICVILATATIACARGIDVLLRMLDTTSASFIVRSGSAASGSKNPLLNAAGFHSALRTAAYAWECSLPVLRKAERIDGRRMPL
eukprot:gene16973-biopygen17141